MMSQSLLSEKQFNMLFNKSKDFVFLCKKLGNDYTYIYTNPVARSIFNEEVIGKKLTEVRSIELTNLIVKYYNLALELNEQQSFQDYITFESEVRKYETTVLPIIHQEQQYILAITKEIAFERDLQDKYLFMRNIFFKTLLSTILVSKDLKLLEANSAFIQTFNIDMQIMRGKRFLDLNFIDQDTMEELQQYLVEAQHGGMFATKLVHFIDREGVKRSFTATFSPLRQENEVVAVFIILQDITKYFEQEQMLHQTSHILETFKRAMDSAADISITDINGKIVDVNERFLKQTGYTREEIIGNTHQIVNSRYHPPEFFHNLWATIRSGNVWHGEICNHDKYGVTYWNETTIIPLNDLEGNITQYLGIHFNVSEKKRVMTQLRNIERTFRVITENTNDLIIITDEDGIISYASPSYVRLLGYEEEKLLGKFYAQLLAEESVSKWQTVLEGFHDNTREQKVELKLQGKHGELFWTEGHYKVVYSNDYNGMNQLIMLSREITERKKRESILMFMAYHDSLTNLPNRRYLDKEFPHLLEKAESKYESIAIVYIDGDNFKEINDCYGHDVGDQFICQFSHALVKSVSLDNLVVRVGGDEFVVILTNLSRNKEIRTEQVQTFIERVRMHLHEGWAIGEHYFQTTASMGVAFYPDHGEKLEKLVDLADQALCESKSNQKNSYKIYD
ncbi:PAS domain S-box protein [Lysinibacillus sp. KU-BSD001]|uniref:PAS domain S-box protein n=1 Tax=Lysinibacillus sp. KU-BSD001 TaxID=3141328 RepID=UPI0036EEF0C0